MLFSPFDKLKDPVVHSDIDDKYLTTFFIQMPLDSFVLQFYDWQTGDVIEYDESIKQYGIERTRRRFRCLFTNITSNTDELDLFALIVKSVNIWHSENVTQIELQHLSDWDYSVFFKYFKITRIYREPDLILSYKS
jgi:hypothetical protein